MYVPPKRLYLPTSPYGVTTQKTNIDIFTAVRTSDLILLFSMSINNYLPEDGCLLGCSAV
jgi:hypothetical protein